MKIQEIINNLESREGKRKSYDFSRMRALLEELSNPHKNMKYIHIAGTNGKGSTSNFVYNMLKAQGYKVGLYTSPHLERYSERIVINGNEISNKDFVENSELVLKAEKKIEKEFEQLTFFEFITAIAFLYFKKEKCDYSILEVGMGGLSDSTNVIESSDKLASIITPISMDHTQFLGNNIEEIAYQKAGIIKENVLTTTSNSNEIIKNILKETAKENNSQIYSLDDIEIENLEVNDNGSKYDLIFKGEKIENLEIKLLGYYQMHNSALAVMTLMELRNRSLIEISNESIKKGLKNTFWAGRMEIINEEPKIILDGAHNFDGIKNLTENFKIFNYKKLYVIASILDDKEHDKMLEELSKYANNIVLVGLHTKRKSNLLVLKEEASKNNVSVEIIEDLKVAIKETLKKACKDDLIVISGSLYLVSETKEIIDEILK